MKKRSIPTIGFCLSLLLTYAGPARSQGEPTIKRQYFYVRQERLSQAGVLISRPLTQDRRLVDFLTMNNIRDLGDYSRWITDHLDYRQDLDHDQWSDPETTLKSQRGDCEDFAFLSSAVVRVFGYEPHFIAMQQGRRAHAICAFQKNGYYHWFDNAELKSSPARSLPELVRHLASNYRYSFFYELDLPSQRWQLLLKKS